MRLMALCMLAAGCGSSSASSPDLASACTLTASGDVAAIDACRTTLCHPTGTDHYEALSMVGTTSHVHFEVDGVFTLRSYAVADLKTLDAALDANGKHYAAGTTLAGSTAALTVTGLVAPTANPCDGTGHGSATLTLVEYDQSTGMGTGSGRVGLAVAF